MDTGTFAEIDVFGEPHKARVEFGKLVVEPESDLLQAAFESLGPIGHLSGRGMLQALVETVGGVVIETGEPKEGENNEIPTDTIGTADQG